MTVSPQDVKKLWGAAAGLCARPGCDQDCLPYLERYGATAIGEMAHVIPRSPTGPRGGDGAGPDTYENLILLCPTDHTIVDKAPDTYTAELLRHWKDAHESRVREALSSPFFVSSTDLFRYISPLLAENRACWSAYGPEGALAQSNAFSTASEIWDLRKLSVIVPNNTRIVAVIKRHREYFTADQYEHCAAFIEHAAGFAENCYTRHDDVPRFPESFKQIVSDECK